MSTTTDTPAIRFENLAFDGVFCGLTEKIEAMIRERLIDEACTTQRGDQHWRTFRAFEVTIRLTDCEVPAMGWLDNSFLDGFSEIHWRAELRNLIYGQGVGIGRYMVRPGSREEAGRS